MKKALQSVDKFPSENPNPVLRISNYGELLYANAAARPILKALGITRSRTLKGRWKQTLQEVYSSGQPADMEIESGENVFSMVLMPIEETGCVNLYGRDITARKETELRLKVLSTAIEHSVNIIFVTDLNGVIRYVNSKFEEVTGYTSEEALGQTPRILSSGETPDRYYKELWSTILSGRTYRQTMKNRKKSGGYYWSSIVVSPIKDESGKITHFLAVQEDITERMGSQKRLQYLSAFDEITGLMNRSRFMELLAEWIKSAEAGGPAGSNRTGVLLLMDIDQFKFLNDTYGHATGDEFLRSLAEMLKATLKDLLKKHLPDTVIDCLISRPGGDEFAVFLPSIDAKTGVGFAEEIKKAVESFRFKEDYGALTVSIGVVEYPSHGTGTSELFTKADAAMYKAKELGRNRCHLYRHEDLDLEKMHSRIRWKERILKALKEDRFEPWFQPILEIKTGAVNHYEALARMRDVEGRVLLPGAFIEVAERFGIVGAIDRVIIEKTMRLQALMKQKGKAISFSVNLSGKDLGDKELLAFLKSAIKETGADPSHIVFEITETAAIDYLKSAIEFIKALKELGCLFALDDFGVGFTSFTYLKRMDIDFIKIDGSFIRRLNEDPADQLFVKAMTEVAGGLGIKTIAEFVENGETLEILKGLGVDFAQGYHIGKPGPALGYTDADRPVKTP
jgi:diguanylate cyclase (GGDEF)-like protein/PAS domain S-box-containing protein